MLASVTNNKKTVKFILLLYLQTVRFTSYWHLQSLTNQFFLLNHQFFLLNFSFYFFFTLTTNKA